MPRLATLFLGLMLLTARVDAQSVTLHDSPQGVTSCTIPDAVTAHTIGTGICPLISFQTHWKPGGGSPHIDPPNTLLHDLAHTHIECNLPNFGEVAGPFRVPCRLQAFHLAGEIAGSIDQGQVTTFTMDPGQPWPVVGDPNGVVISTFHLTFDPTRQYLNNNPANAKILQDHGWINLMFGVRTFVDNGDTYDTQMWFTLWSMVNPAVDPQPEGEGSRIDLSTKSTAISARDTVVGPWGAHLIEVRDELLPMWAPFSTPIAADVFSYTYGGSPNLSTAYHLVCGNDYHNGGAGIEMTFVTATVPISNEPFNHDFFDPLKIIQTPALPGFPANQTRCTVIWQEETPDNQAIPDGRYPGVIAAGEQLFSLMSFDVAIGPNPVGCNATCSNAIGASVTPAPQPQPTPKPVPPPPPPPPAIPNVVGIAQVAATSSLSAAGFKVRTVSTASSSTVAVGLVISQNPAAGTAAPAGTPVDLVISRGTAPASLPTTGRRPTAMRGGEEDQREGRSRARAAESMLLMP